MAKPANRSVDLKANVIRVLDEIKRRVESPDYNGTIDDWAEAIDTMLDELKNEDYFGSEASTDPRGDFRNGKWSIWEMEAKA